LECKKGRDHLGDLVVDGRVIFKLDLKEIVFDSVVWIQLTKDRIQWRAQMNRLIDLWVP
jgi:hypothetical protein